MINFSERQIRWGLVGLGLGSFALILGLEVAVETDEIRVLDLLVDAVHILLTIAASVGVALLVLRMNSQHDETMTLIRDLAIARNEGEKWRSDVQDSIAGIRAAMTRQFADWQMTDAEQEVGLLILKGLSHKEIARLRGTAAATVRQQAQAVYQKSGLPGKLAFSAYFLEDLFALETPAGADGSPADRRDTLVAIGKG